LQRGAQLVHLLSASAWLGALPPLTFLLAGVARDRFEVAAVARTVLRFSSVGVVAVALIVVSGIANTMLVTGWSGNPFTFRLPGTYDSILLAKVVVFLLMVGIAITNRFILTPQLAGASKEKSKALRWFWLTILAEQALGLIVLLLAAALGTADPSPV
jgi:putative copper resistance protein D